MGGTVKPVPFYFYLHGVHTTMISVFRIQLRAMPKPRGHQSGRGGHIYHSSAKYNQYNLDIKNGVRNSGFKKPENTLYHCFKFIQRKKGGHLPDGENLQGGVQDALVKCGILDDDDIKNISRWYGEYTFSDHDEIVVYFCQTKAEFKYLLDKVFD